MIKGIILFSILGLQIFSQPKELSTGLSEISFLVGEWKGESAGVEGDGVCTKTVTFEMDSNYIISTSNYSFRNSKSEPPTDSHEHKSVYSSNLTDSSLVKREFNSEGHTIYFNMVSDNSQSDRLIFSSKNIENGPPGLRVRSTLIDVSASSCREILEYKYPSREYMVWRNTSWEKIE